jgi:hypothetical protein
LATKDHIISHDARLAVPSKDVPVVRVKTLAIPGTMYYPEAPGHFPNEIMPRLLALHEYVPLHVPLLWPDTILARRILDELIAFGEFRDRQILFHNTGHGLLYVESAYVYVYANDRAYRNNYAGASIKQLQSLHSLFRRVTARGPSNNNSYGIVFWMRNLGSVRSISNMEEILNELNDWDINCISHDSSLPYFEQASILRDTHVFISPHGAGMNNVLFLSNGATAIEVVYSDSSFRCPEEYYCLCSAIGVEYYMTAAEGDSNSQLRVLFPSEIRDIINNSLTKQDALGVGLSLDTRVNNEFRHQKAASTITTHKTAGTTEETILIDSWTEQAGNGVSKYIFHDLLHSKPSMGTFVEFGCADGVTNSNTFVYEKMGWTGLCIEPNYQNYLKAQKSRKFVIHGLVTSHDMNFTYAQMSGECDQASGIIEFYSQAFMDIMRDCEEKGLVEHISMKGNPLNHYLDMFGMDRVDWVSVDCEGCEAAFITSFDFTKYQVQIVNYEPNTAARMHTEEIDAALKLHGFAFDRELQDVVYRRGEFQPTKIGAGFRIPSKV